MKFRQFRSVATVVVALLPAALIGCSRSDSQVADDPSADSPRAIVPKTKAKPTSTAAPTGTRRQAKPIAAASPAPSATRPAQGTVMSYPINEPPAATIDPFQPLVRLDPDRLPASCESIVGFQITTSSGSHFLHTGFVFDADAQLAYVTISRFFLEAISQIADSSTPPIYQAIVGNGPKPRVVTLSLVGKAQGATIFSAPKKDLPPPLSLTTAPATPPVGRRLHLIGYESPEGEMGFGQSGRLGWTRTAVPTEVISTGNAKLMEPLWFAVDKPKNLRLRSALIVADDGAVVALGFPKEIYEGGRNREIFEAYPLNYLANFRPQ